MREKAESSHCVQNLRQIGIGLHAHISENNGRFPNGKAHVSWLKDEEKADLGLSWYDAAAKTMGREKYSMKSNDPDAEPLPEVFGCPSGNGKPYHPEWPYTGDYAANIYLGRIDHKVPTMSAVNRTERSRSFADRESDRRIFPSILPASKLPQTRLESGCKKPRNFLSYGA